MSVEDATSNFDTPERCSEIICTECGSPPRLLSLNKNAGTTLCCDCDDVKHHQDAVPYEFATHHMPNSWTIVEENSESVRADEVQQPLFTNGLKTED